VLFLTYYIYKTKQSTSSSSKSTSNSKSSTSSSSDASSSKEEKSQKDEEDANLKYILTNLHPNSTHFDVLFTIATSPENIKLTTMAIEKANELKAKRMDFLGLSNGTGNASGTGSSSSSSSSNKDEKKEDPISFDLDGTWGDDDEDELTEEQKAEKEKQKQKEQLAKEIAQNSSQKENIAKHLKIEGVDDNVLGQNWVQEALEKNGAWPPNKVYEWSGMSKVQYEWEGKKVENALDHPAVKRNLIMTMGRLNSEVLNGNPELMQAGSKQLIDSIYFKGSLEYRQRTQVLLDAALRITASTKSYRLYKTIIECVTMFMVGTTSFDKPEHVKKFQSLMERTFGGPNGVPRIIISSLDILPVSAVIAATAAAANAEEGDKAIVPPTPIESTSTSKNIGTNETCVLEIEMNRIHQENFMKQKIAMAMKQGIPPQIALQTFREAWWIILRCVNLDTSDESEQIIDNSFMDKHDIFKSMESGVKDKFVNEICENRLWQAWPFVVTNMQQKAGKIKVKFMAPSKPGNYKFFVDIKSQQYLGCDQALTLEKKIFVSESKVVGNGNDGGKEDLEVKKKN